MKNLIVFIIAILAFNYCQAQLSGTIKYSEAIKLDIELPEGMEIEGMTDHTMSSEQQLQFDNAISVYSLLKGNEPLEKEMSSDDGSFRMVMKMDVPEEVYYTDHQEKKMIHKTGFMGKDFLIEKGLEKLKWKITDEKIKYLGFVCQKATTIITEEEEEQNVVAWFTTEIPLAIGPADFNQLPGAILMVSVDEGKTEIKATEVVMQINDPEVFTKPTKGKKVSQAEFDKIVEEKTKEMEEESGGRERIMIRG